MWVGSAAVLLKPPAQHVNEIPNFPDALALYAIPENYFEVVNEDFYVPNELQDVTGSTDLSSGKVNPISLLYLTEDIPSYPETIPNVNAKNAYKVTF